MKFFLSYLEYLEVKYKGPVTGKQKKSQRRKEYAAAKLEHKSRKSRSTQKNSRLLNKDCVTE